MPQSYILPPALQGKRVAVVSDWLTNRGGAERVTEVIADIFNADVFTSVFVPNQFKGLGHKVTTSFLQLLPPKLRQKHQYFLHLMPAAFRSLDMSGYDIIISSASSFAKSIQKKSADQVHVCYCHSPPRYLYFIQKDYLKTYPLPWYLTWARHVLPPILSILRREDQRSLKGVDQFIANSKTTEQRIEQYYRTDARVVYPNVEIEPFIAASEQTQKQAYFLALGRMVPYKQFPLIVKAFIENGLPLKIGGTGPDFMKCKALIKEHNATNIELLGFVDEADIPYLYAEAKGFIFPSHEDFGIVPVEAMAAGTPVVYYNQGGATESVAGVGGVAFNEQTTQSLNEGITRLLERYDTFSKEILQAQASKFRTEVFAEKLIAEVIRVIEKKDNRGIV